MWVLDPIAPINQRLAPAWSLSVPVPVDTDFVTAVGRRLHDLRVASGLTQEALAERAGIQAVTLSRIETGRKPGSISVYAALARGLGVTVSELMAVDADVVADHPVEVQILIRMIESMSPEQVDLATRLLRELIR